MLEVGARFANNLYSKLSFDPDNGDAVVTVEMISNEGEKLTITGTVVWDEDDGGLDDGGGLG